MTTGTSEQLRTGSNWSIGTGILLIVLGLAAFVLPFSATLITEGWIAAFLFFAGTTKIVNAFQTREDGGFLWKLVLGILYVATAALLLFYPLQGVLTLTLVLATFLFTEGIFEIILAFRLRPQTNWLWVLGNGIITLVLGAMIWFQFPFDAPWAIGTLVGASIFFTGVSRLMLALAARSS